MDEARRRDRLRSFAIGGLVGAAGALATVRRSRRQRRSDLGPTGLDAFEGAPCYRELVAEDDQPGGDGDDGGDTSAGPSNAT